MVTVLIASKLHNIQVTPRNVYTYLCNSNKFNDIYSKREFQPMRRSVPSTGERKARASTKLYQILQQIFNINNRLACSDIKILWIYICITIAIYYRETISGISEPNEYLRQFHLISASIFFMQKLIVTAILSCESFQSYSY